LSFDGLQLFCWSVVPWLWSLALELIASAVAQLQQSGFLTLTPLWCHSRIHDWFLFHAVCFCIWELQMPRSTHSKYRYSSLCF